MLPYAELCDGWYWTGQNNEQNRNKRKEEREKETGDTKEDGGQGDGIRRFLSISLCVIVLCSGSHGNKSVRARSTWDIIDESNKLYRFTY